MSALMATHALIWSARVVTSSHLPAALATPTQPETSPPILAICLALVALAALFLHPRDKLVRLFTYMLLCSAVIVVGDPRFERGDLLGTVAVAAANGLAASFFARFGIAFSERWRSTRLTPSPWRQIYAAGPLIPLLTALIYILTLQLPAWVSGTAEALNALGTAACLILGLVALGRTFRQTSARSVRGKILVVWLGAIATFVPLLFLNVLPHVILQPSIVPFDTSGYWLALLPLTTGFAAIRWRRASLLTMIDRVSVYGVLALTLVALYAGVAVLIAWLAGVRFSSLVHMLSLGVVVIVAFTFAPLRDRTQRLVDTLLYRDYYDLGPTLQRFGRSLATLRNQQAVANTVLRLVCDTLNLDGAAFVPLPDGLSSAVLRLIEPGDVYVRRTFAREGERASLVAALHTLDPSGLDASHRQPVALDPWMGCAALVLVGPGGGEDVTALLLVGPKRGGGTLNPRDRALLATVAHHAATALENATLMNGLYTTLDQLRHVNANLLAARTEQQLLLREVVDAEERQRAALARELHDDALQDLVYLSRHSQYCADLLAGLGSHAATPAGPALDSTPGGKRLRAELEELAQAAGASERKLRDLCAGLYPTLLESLGLPAALEALAEDPVVARGLDVHVACDRSAETLAQHLDSGQRLHLYRIAHEAVRNTQRHAAAVRVDVNLAVARAAPRRSQPELGGYRLELSVTDDGTGMPLPVDYVALLRDRHLGLASIRERAERIGAALDLTPGPAGGTRLAVTLPLGSALAALAAAASARTDPSAPTPSASNPSAPMTSRSRARQGVAGP